MAKAKKYEGLFSIPAQDGNFTSAIGRLGDAELEEFLAELTAREIDEHCHKGRIKAVGKEIKTRSANSKEIIAVVKKDKEIIEADNIFGDGMAYELDRMENEIRFYQDQAGSALLEMGKRLIRIKAHEMHGDFMASLERLGIAARTAQYAMLAARKFSNAPALAHLETAKMKVLTVLADDDVEALEKGGEVNGKNLDAISAMSYREVCEYARKTSDALKKEKDTRKKDRETQEAAIAQKERKINELDQQLRYRQPPTKEQLALAELQKLNEPYTFCLARINAGIREAYNLVREAEKIKGVNLQQISEWLRAYP
ncbi:hypothetical protein FACS1894190_16020 [Spirochaetia bacterium]|nr:hypothetical protein FACS1894190_16020 [Spirochaetia bacterium]